ncbi:MAG: endonuclease/exonuclease/phosphatase family protein [Clostridia bacterium]|nr:endonuclease/exonuclease/phosphatase family protein [Clostridia bacterium]
MKKAKKIIISIVSVILALLIAFGVSFVWYYPYYNSNKAQVNVEVENNGGIKMMSYNLRCISPLDFGKKSWFYRADLIIDDIVNEKPGIIGFQEATKWHYAYLTNALQGYDSVITYRDEAFNSEGCPIFYNTSMYTLVDKGSFWLSETPEVMSKSWGAQYNRVCSYVILTDNASGEDFVVFNTHLSHVSDEARINGIKVVLDKIAQFGSLPSVIMGDFNAQEGSETYIQVTENFTDARYATENTNDSYTYQGWGNPEKFKRIDYFMISKTEIKVNKYDVLSGLHDGVYSSDHCPIVLEFSLDK